MKSFTDCAAALLASLEKFLSYQYMNFYYNLSERARGGGEESTLYNVAGD